MGLLLIVLHLLACSTASADEIEIIQLNNRTVDEIIPIVSPLLEPGDAVTGTGYKLILRAAPRTVREVRRILSKIDKGLHNLAITVRQFDAAEADRGAASGSVRADSETGGTVSGSVAHDTTRSDWQGSQRIRVLEGSPAFIHTGISVFPQEITPYAYGVDHGQRDVGAGVYVVPRLNGTRVNLEISPYREAFSGHRYDADVRNLSTVVSGRLGEWIFIGGAVQAENGAGRGILSGATGASESRHGVHVRVDLAE